MASAPSILGITSIFGQPRDPRTWSSAPANVAKALEGIEVQGITGNIKISPETHNPEGKDAAILKIVNGQYVFQEKYAAQ